MSFFGRQQCPTAVGYDENKSTNFSLHNKLQDGFSLLEFSIINKYIDIALESEIVVISIPLQPQSTTNDWCGLLKVCEIPHAYSSSLSLSASFFSNYSHTAQCDLK